MKKLLVATVAILGLFLGNSARAEEEKTSSVEYMQSSSYEMEIPARIVLNKNESTSFVIWTKLNITPSENLEVRVIEGVSDEGNIDLNRKNSNDKVTTSLYKKKSGLMTEDKLLTKSENLVETFAGKTSDSNGGIKNGTPMLIGPPVGKLLAGSYSGTITFQTELVNVSNKKDLVLN